MKKVLIVAYHFPPGGGAGVQRTLKFIKYLRLYDWEPIVVTVKKPSVPSYDYTLSDDLPDNILIVRTSSLEISYGHKQNAWQKMRSQSKDGKAKLGMGVLSKIIKYVSYIIFTPDYQVGWVPFAVSASLKILKSYKIDAIFISVPPFSSLLIGIALRIITGKKWISDFRDEWLESLVRSLNNHKRPFGHCVLRAIEQQSVRSAYLVTTVSRGIVQNFQKKYPNLNKRFIYLPNGFDPEDFPSDKFETFSENGKFTLTYTGTLFSVTTPKYFLLALEDLVSKFPELLGNLSINIVGRITEDIMPFFNVPKLREIINIVGYTNHNQSILYLLKSHVLILIIDELPDAGNIVTGKIFEYLAAQKPILALIPQEGEAANIVRQTKSGIVIPPRDVNKISNQILKLYKDYKTGNLCFQPEISSIQQFNRKLLAKQLALHLERCRI
jgi:glycosyltransferase involved in cell wall biosynthesis